jgi:hypothetical protein
MLLKVTARVAQWALHVRQGTNPAFNQALYNQRHDRNHADARGHVYRLHRSP